MNSLEELSGNLSVLIGVGDKEEENRLLSVSEQFLRCYLNEGEYLVLKKHRHYLQLVGNLDKALMHAPGQPSGVRSEKNKIKALCKRCELLFGNNLAVDFSHSPVPRINALTSPISSATAVLSSPPTPLPLPRTMTTPSSSIMHTPEQSGKDKLGTIYILLCADNHFYVGRTQQPVEDRILQHILGQGSAWTKKYPYVETIQIIENQCSFAEDMYVKKYMSAYTIDRVRGGTYCQIQLPPQARAHLEKELLSQTDCCYRCGKNTHMVNTCTETVDKAGNSIPTGKISSIARPTNLQFSASSSSATQSVGLNPLVPPQSEECSSSSCSICLRCGRVGHRIDKCFARYNTTGFIIEDEDVKEHSWTDICIRCGRSGHRLNDCYAAVDVNGQSLREEKLCGRTRDRDNVTEDYKPRKKARGSDSCYRCGRDSHYASECYAKKDINGEALSDDASSTATTSSRPRNISRNCGDMGTVANCGGSTAKAGRSAGLDSCCFRCGRNGHFSSDCYTKTSVLTGNYISSTSKSRNYSYNRFDSEDDEY